jgi:c-di-GMP-binding flagellar brake protein YcgR
VKAGMVYPTVIMSISCPNCGAEGSVKRARSPQQDLTALCWKCGRNFLIKINRRNYYRKKVSIPVMYSSFDIDTLDDQKAWRGRIVDISRQGMAVQSYRQICSLDCKDGTLFTFLFSLPLINDLQKVQGEIMRLIKEEQNDFCTIGIRFSELHRFTDNGIRFFLSL